MAVPNSAGRSGRGGVPLRWGCGGGRLRVVRYGGRTRHSGRALRRYVDRHAIERVTVDGGLVTADQVAEPLAPHPCGRRSRLDYLATKQETPSRGMNHEAASEFASIHREVD